MPKEGEVNWPRIVDRAAQIVLSYNTGVTLRQLFYRLVSSEVIPNTKSAYQRLSKVTAIARRAGDFPDLIDNTRGIQVPSSWDSADDAMEGLIEQYRRDRTEEQEYTIYLGVEKNALRVQLQGWFRQRGIPVLAFGGYPSQTFVNDIMMDIEAQGRPAILLYGGDFDATGVDILRDFRKRTAGCWEDTTRIALNEDQIAEHKLPPLPGKPWDPRAASFEAAYGELIQVELDALPPDVLKKIYEDAVAPFWNEKAYKKSMKQEAEDRAKLIMPDRVADMYGELIEVVHELKKHDRGATKIADAFIETYDGVWF